MDQVPRKPILYVSSVTNEYVDVRIMARLNGSLTSDYPSEKIDPHDCQRPCILQVCSSKHDSASIGKPWLFLLNMAVVPPSQPDFLSLISYRLERIKEPSCNPS